MARLDLRFALLGALVIGASGLCQLQGVHSQLIASSASKSRAAPIVLQVKSWFDQGIRLDEEKGSIDIFALPPRAAAPAAPQRESVEEAWERAPEGSFLSPAKIAGLLFVSLSLRFLLFGADGPKF